MSKAAGAADPGIPTPCNPSIIFNVAGSQTNPAPTGSASGNLYTLNVTTGANTLIGRFSSGTTPVNGLGVTPSLSAAYVVAQNASTSGQAIYTFTQAGTTSSTPGPNTGLTLVMGAVDPANGIFYYAGYTGSGSSLMLAVYGYNPATNTALGRLFTVSLAGLTPAPSTGDLAFDSNGNMFVVAGTNVTTGSNTSRILLVTGPLPTTATSPVPVFTYTPLATNTAPAGAGFYNGIAFAANGTLYAQYATQGSATLQALSPSGGVTATIPESGEPSIGILTDLAGCALPGTLTVQKNLPDGRAGANDQFTMTVTGGGLTQGNTNTTTGTAPGIQAQKVGPLPGIPTTVYTISEDLAEGTTTSLDAYASSWSCENTNTSTTISMGTGTSFMLTFPSPVGVLGATIVCTFTNTPVPPSLTLTKALGGAGRIVDTDQFTMQIQSPPGTVVGTTTNATTTGTGATVTDGTGTTTVTPATAGTAYTLTEVAAGTTTLADYTQDIQCTDENGVQTTGLPDGTFTPSPPPRSHRCQAPPSSV
jgi:hypothetical protein